MAINLSNVLANKATKTIEYGGESCEIVYRPGMVTQERLDSVNNDAEIVTYVTEVLVSWDIRNGTKKLPISEASLNKLPFDLVTLIFRSIISAGGEVAPEA